MSQSSESSTPVSSLRTLAWLWALGLALRLLFVWLEPKTSPVADETMWLMALNRIPAAHFSPFANYPIFHPPLYPYFLAATNALFGSLFAIKVVQALISSLLIPAVHGVAGRVFGGRAAAVAAACAAFYPELIWYSSHFWCETLFLTLLWWAVERVTAADEAGSPRMAAAAGLLFGLAILTRETILYLLPIFALWLLAAKPRRRPNLAIALLTASFAVVAPWTLRNWIQFGAFIPVSTGGGLNLYQGNAEITRGEVYNEYSANEGKVEQFQWARTAGLKAIWKRQPAWIFEKIRDEGPRLLEVDSLALIHSRRGAYGEVSCASYRGAAAIVLFPWLAVALLSLVAITRTRWGRGTVLLVAMLGSYLLLHIATHGFSRYRLPVMPVFMILAASMAETALEPEHPRARRALLVGLAIVLAVLWAPSILDQLGHLGWADPPGYEGFAPVCLAR